MLTRTGALLYARFVNYLLPTVMMALSLSMAVVVDGIIVGNMLGEQGLAAVNLAMPLTLCFSVLHAVFGVGGSVVISLFKGRRDAGSANRTFTIACICLVVIGLCLSLLTFSYAGEISRLLAGGKEELQALVLSYIKPLALGAVILIFVPGFAYFMRTDSHPGLSSLALVTANVVNLVCDIVFIHLTGDIEGASLATVTGYCVGVLITGLYGISKRRTLRLTGRLSGWGALLRGVLKSGIPGGVSQGLMFLRILCINLIVLGLAGQPGMVAASICLSCLYLSSVGISGAAQAMMPIVGVLRGEEDYAGIRFVVRRAAIVIMAATAALVLVLLLFPAFFISLFGVREPEALSIGIQAVRLYAPSLLGVAFSYLMLFYLLAVNRSAMAMTLSIVESFAVVVPVAWLLSRFMGLPGVWLAFSVAEIAGFILVIVWSRLVSAKSAGQLQGLLMLPLADDVQLDATIPGTESGVEAALAEIRALCENREIPVGTAESVAGVVRELLYSAIGHPAGGSRCIDIMLRMRENDVRVSLRDAGAPFNPKAHLEGDTDGSGHMPYNDFACLRRHAAGVEYSYNLGFNSCAVTIALHTDDAGNTASPEG